MALTQKQENFCLAYKETKSVSAAIDASGAFELDDAPVGYYVYLLINPITDEVFYVGKGKGRRALDHRKEAKRVHSCNPRKSMVISSFSDAGIVELIKYEKCDSEMLAFAVEREVISALKGEGLTNIQMGVVSSDEVAIEKVDRFLKMMPPFALWESVIVSSVREAAINIYGSTRACYDSIRAEMLENVAHIKRNGGHCVSC